MIESFARQRMEVGNDAETSSGKKTAAGISDRKSFTTWNSTTRETQDVIENFKFIDSRQVCTNNYRFSQLV